MDFIGGFNLSISATTLRRLTAGTRGTPGRRLAQEGWPGKLILTLFLHYWTTVSRMYTYAYSCVDPASLGVPSSVLVVLALLCSLGRRCCGSLEKESLGTRGIL